MTDAPDTGVTPFVTPLTTQFQVPIVGPDGKIDSSVIPDDVGGTGDVRTVNGNRPDENGAVIIPIPSAPTSSTLAGAGVAGRRILETDAPEGVLRYLGLSSTGEPVSGLTIVATARPGLYNLRS